MAKQKTPTISAPALAPKRPEPEVSKQSKAMAGFDARIIAQNLALNSAQCREQRLKDLAKKNLDVKWLLEEYEKLNAKNK